MKITENPDGTYTLNPGRTVAELVEKIKAKDRKISEQNELLRLASLERTDLNSDIQVLRQELKASREAHHKTTDELRKLKLAQKEALAEKPVELDLDRILDVAVLLFGGKPRRQ